MKKQSHDENPWRALAFVGFAGVDIAVCVTAGYFLGVWMKEWLGGEPVWLAIGVIAGLAAGVLNIIYFIKKFMEDSNG